MPPPPPTGAPPANLSFFCQEETCFSCTSAGTSYAAASAACLQLGGELVRPWSGQQQVGSVRVVGMTHDF